MDDLVFLFDVDNTLIDNDHVQADLRHHLAIAYGPAARDRYWEIFEELRAELGYVDYLGALQRYRRESLHDPRVLRIAPWLADYHFAERLYQDALAAVRHVQQFGTTVILSDGDAAFQPMKVERSGLWRAFDDNVLIFIHKEESLDDVERLFPARHYVMIDDKLRILDALKRTWGDRVTTVFPQQGHYAWDPQTLAQYAHGDIQLQRIGDLLRLDQSAFVGGQAPRP
ncbi:MAG TPA: HAD family hydrolase [Acetobacteraceae bacterium]|nr:HAD family hydrolase [Acetobacteraceae bacterium]